MHCVSVLFCFLILFLWMYVVQKMEVWNLTDFKNYFFCCWILISNIVFSFGPSVCFFRDSFSLFLVLGWLIFFLDLVLVLLLLTKLVIMLLKLKVDSCLLWKTIPFASLGFFQGGFEVGFLFFSFLFFQGGVD